MKSLVLVPLLAFMFMFACPSNPSSQSLEANARDAAAALGGELQTAQAQNQACIQDPTPVACQTIKRGVSGQNALVTALETYCGWSVAAEAPPVGTPCTPVSTAQGALTFAITNANQLVTEVKGTVHP